MATPGKRRGRDCSSDGAAVPIRDRWVGAVAALDAKVATLRGGCSRLRAAVEIVSMTEPSLREFANQAARACAAYGLLVLAACGGGSRIADTGPAPDPDTIAAVIGPAGGQLAFAAGSHQGVAIEVPAGAVATATTFAITAVRNARILSAFPVYRFEPRGVDFAVPVRLHCRVSPSLIDAQGDADVVGFVQPTATASWQALFDSSFTPGTRTFTATATRLGDCVAWNGALHRLFTQDRDLLDPAVEAAADGLTSLPAVVANGRGRIHVGRGSLQSFWHSPASANVLIVPGFLASALDFLGAEDLVATLPAAIENVVIFDYPSGLGVAATANALYDEIAANKQAGFGCAIVGHSLGGLVARYLLEKSADDPARAGFHAGDPSFAAFVPHLVLLGVPNAGSDLGQGWVDGVLSTLPASEQFLLQGAIDLSYRTDSTALQMNATYADNATRYHLVYGDLGGGTDGVVTTASALALPVLPPETATLFVATHDALHAAAGSNGITAHIAALLQAP